MAPPSILDYARDVASSLAGVPASLVVDARLTRLLAAASALQMVAADLEAAIAGGGAVPPALAAQWTASLAEWRAVQAALRAELDDYLVGRLPALPGLDRLAAAVEWTDMEGLRGTVAVGPLRIALAGQSLLVKPTPAGAAEALGPLRPDTLAATLAGPLEGGGALRVLDAGVAGVVHLALGAVDVSAIASLRRLRPGIDPSFLAIIGIAFTPGIQLGLGFSLNRVGGIVGVNRRVEIAAIAHHVRSGTAADVLFAADPASDAARLLAAAEQMYAPALGRHLIGPTFQLGWLKVSSGSFFRLDVGAILELPGPSRFVIAGSATAEIPGPLLRLRLDLFGWIDTAQKEVGFDASLVDSGLLGVFTIAGDAAFRLSYGARPYALLSIGGFFPGFNPEPALVPPMRRASLSTDSPLPGLAIHAEAYFAVTSNTLQFGGRLDVVFDAAAVEASGFLAIDALIQFAPFHFHAACSAGFRVRAVGRTFAGVRLDGTVDGPGPLVISGRLTIETFLVDISWHETFTIGASGGDTRVPAQKLLDVLASELTRPENLRAEDPTDPLVVIEPRARQGTLALVSPIGELQWVQRRAPLGIPIDRLEGVPLGGVQGVRASSPATRGAARALFSPGSYITLTAAEALNRPAFDELDAGLRIGWATAEEGPSQTSDAKFKVIRRVRGEPDLPLVCPGPLSMLARAHPGAVMAMIGDRSAPAAPSSTAPAITLTGEPWATADGATHTSATAAHQQVRTAGGRLALPALDMSQPLSLAGV